MDIVESLMKAGFTRHESTLYVTLCGEGELTGYEAAKISGISRSNAYLALSGLVEKGGAYKIDGEAVKYIAIPAKELVFNIKSTLHEVLEYIEKNVPARNDEREPYITIEGRRHIINKMKYIVD